MIDKVNARRIAEQFIARMPLEDDQLVIMDDRTIEKPYGWVFFYTSQKWLQGDDRFAIAGNGPLVVEREDGDVRPLPTCYSPESAVKKYEEEWRHKWPHWRE